MKPSEILINKRQQMLEVCRRYPVSNPRVFGSVVYGTDTEQSDLDIVVDVPKVKNPRSVTRPLEEELTRLAGVKVQVAYPALFRTDVKAEVEATAQHLHDFAPRALLKRFQRMKEKRLLHYLREMNKWGQRTHEFIADTEDEDTFIKNEKDQCSVAKALEEFGENCSKTYNHARRFAAKHPEFPWKKVREVRNDIAHEYGTLNPGMIWQVATMDLPVWQRQLEELISEVETTIASKEDELEL